MDDKTIADMLSNGSFDIESMLRDDPLYKTVIASMPEDQREHIIAIVTEFVKSIQTGAFDRMAVLAKDPAFTEAWMAAMTRQK